MTELPTFPVTGFVRLKQIISPGPIPCCAATWWNWVKTGKAPKPVRLGSRMTVWRAEDIRAMFTVDAKEAA